MGIANISGNILTDSGTNLSSLVSGSGTTNYLPKFTGASTIGNSLIFDNGSNGIGLGTTSPSSFTGYNGFTTDGSTGGFYDLFSSGTRKGTFNTTASLVSIGSTGTTDLAILTNNTAKMYITSAGNVGIGTSSPDNLLDVYGTGTNTTRIRVRGTTNFALFQAQNDSSSALYMGIDSSTASGFNVGNYSRLIWSGGAYPLVIATNDTERMRITSGGNVMVGSNSDSGYKFDVRGQSYFEGTNTNCLTAQRLSSDGFILTFYKNGTLVGSISTNANSLPSDLNFKKNINNLELGLNLVSKLRPVSYNHKIDDEGAALSTGFIAQELEQSLIELGVEQNQYYILQHQPNEDKTQSEYWLDYTKMIPVLVKAIQELSQEVNELKAKLA